MRNALSTRFYDGYAWRTATRYASGAGFSKQAPGGFFDARVHLSMPLSTFTDLGQADLMAFDDRRTGRTVWDGFVQAPTPVSGRDGQSWDVAAVGGSVVASDESQPLIYIDQALDRFAPALRGTSAAGSNGQAPSDTDYGQGLLVQFAGGSPVTGSTSGGGSVAGMGYSFPAGLEFGSMGVTCVSGKVDSGYLLRLFYKATSGSDVRLLGNAGAMSQTPYSNSVWAGQVNPTYQPPVGTTAIQLRLQRTGGAGNVQDDLTWAFFYNLFLQMRRMDRYGVLKTGQAGMGDPTYLTADLVVEDLLGRVLTMCDPTTAQVDVGSYHIDQLSYVDGAKAATVLDDLMNFETGMLWEIGRLLPNGLRQFALRYWPTTPRYLLGSDVQIEQQGSDVDLANRLLVTWTDLDGTTTTRAFGQEVLALGAGSPVNADGTPNLAFTGRTVDAEPVALPDGKGSLANAAQVAAGVLAGAAGTAPPAAKATVAYQVYDRLRNMRVEPHELEPGYLARRLDTGDDLRVTNVDYTDDDGVAVLDLGIPAPTVDQRLAQLAKVKVAA